MCALLRAGLRACARDRRLPRGRARRRVGAAERRDGGAVAEASPSARRRTRFPMLPVAVKPKLSSAGAVTSRRRGARHRIT
eukprot:6174764-Pleurochrysis_carterae.AAC.3